MAIATLKACRSNALVHQPALPLALQLVDAFDSIVSLQRRVPAVLAARLAELEQFCFVGVAFQQEVGNRGGDGVCLLVAGRDHLSAKQDSGFF